jgi:hypothetical protein
LRAGAAPPKHSLGKNCAEQGDRVFVSRSPARTTPRETGLRYDERASGATVYAYVDGNPLIRVDPFGLQDDSTGKQEAQNGVQGATNLAGAAALSNRAGAISDIGGALGLGAGAIGSGMQSFAQQDYRDFTAPEGGIHDYPQLFGDMDWSQYPTFAAAWKAYLQKRMGKKCP